MQTYAETTSTGNDIFHAWKNHLSAYYENISAT